MEICLHVCSVASVLSNSVQPLDHGPPGSSVHGISQARILEWVAPSCSRGSSPPRDGTQVSCLAGVFFIIEPPKKPCTGAYPRIKCVPQGIPW